MPEGPAILHLRNKLNPFVGKTVKQAGGYGPMPTAWLKGQKLLSIDTHGKHLFFIFKEGTVEVHLMLFGRFLINDRNKVNRKFYLNFGKEEINGYVVQAKKIEGDWRDKYDPRVDILSKDFDKAHVKKLLKEHADQRIDEVLMNQQVFAGVGNKIRNEALYLAGIHPESITAKIPPVKITKLINAVVKYAKFFLSNLETTGKHETFAVYKRDYAEDGSEVTTKVLKRSGRKIYFSEHLQELFV